MRCLFHCPAPSFDISVTSAGVNYPTVDRGSSVVITHRAFNCPFGTSPGKLTSSQVFVTSKNIFWPQKSPSVCVSVVSLPRSPGWCISSNGQKSGKLHVFYGHIINVNLRRGTHLLPDGNIDNVKAWTRTTKCGPGERGKGSFWEWRERGGGGHFDFFVCELVELYYDSDHNWKRAFCSKIYCLLGNKPRL